MTSSFRQALKLGTLGIASLVLAALPSSSFGLTVHVDPETGEFVEPPEPGSTGAKRLPGATSAVPLVESAHPDPRIQGVIQLPEELNSRLIETKTGSHTGVNCD